MKISAKVRDGLRRWWPFLALCSMLLLRWNLAETYPQAVSSDTSMAMGCGVAALLVALRAWSGRQALPSASCLRQAGGAGALLLAGPELALLFQAPLPGSSLVIALGLTPVVVAVAVGIRSTQPGVPSALLGPGIAAVTGLLLLVPEPNLNNTYADAILLLTPLLTGAGCVFFPLGPTGARGRIAAAALGGATVPFLVAAGHHVAERITFVAPSLWAVSGDAILALLAVFALGRLTPTQYSARFVLLPLLALVEGWIVYRLPLTFRPLLGLMLLAAGAIGLLRTPAKQPSDRPPSLVP